MKSSGIGGQAVMEGVMMKNKSKYAVAVRKADNTIEIKKSTHKSASEKNKFFALPIVRGVVNFVDSLTLGVSTLTYSASFFEEEEQVEPTKMEKAFAKVFKDKAEAVTMGLCVALSLVIAIGMFMILPMLLSNFLGNVVTNTSLQILLEGVIRITLFILYVIMISFMKDIKRTFMYHGAEHKAINCIETGHELTVENVRKQSRQHKRCGTSFLLIVMFISVIFFMFIRCETVWLKILLRLLLVPVIAGVSYEFLKLAGRSDNKVIDILSRPGIWLQNLTTREPDDSMIEVAIASVEAVYDWKPFVAEIQKEKEKAKARKKAQRRSKRSSSRENLDRENTNFYSNYRQDGYAEFESDEDEVDEILNALDKMFIEQKEKESEEFESKPSVDSVGTFVRSNRYLNQNVKSESKTSDEMSVEEVVADENEAVEEEVIADENEVVKEEVVADENEVVKEEVVADENEAVKEGFDDIIVEKEPVIEERIVDKEVEDAFNAVIGEEMEHKNQAITKEEEELLGEVITEKSDENEEAVEDSEKDDTKASIKQETNSNNRNNNRNGKKKRKKKRR